MSDFEEIKSPKGIRFECSGCANCCMQWPVPLTQADTERILALAPTAAVKRLASSRANLMSFTHTLEKKADGSCAFLDASLRCKLHTEHGIEAKPSMCHLFPYSFMVTPDAVTVYLSFASSAVILNQGKLLKEQQDVLQSQYAVFKSMFKPQTNLWNKLQSVDGVALPFQIFSEMKKDFLQLIENDESTEDFAAIVRSDSTSTTNNEGYPQKLASKLRECSSRLIQSLDKAHLEREPKLEASPEIVDQLFLKQLEALYFPTEIFRDDNYDFNAKALLSEIIAAPRAVSLGQEESAVPFSSLIKHISKPGAEIENLINRFLYVKFFANMYFGPGFHHLSLLAGLHHLRTLSVLLKLKFKQFALLNDKEIDFEHAAEYVRCLERRLTQLDISRESQAVLEVLLSSPSRQERIDSL